jgi:hypothetical protein
MVLVAFARNLRPLSFAVGSRSLVLAADEDLLLSVNTLEAVIELLNNQCCVVTALVAQAFLVKVAVD